MNFGWYLQQFSFKGRPVSGGTVEFFVAGSTTTPKNIWYDVGNTVVAPNPITLDASGTMPQIYPESGLYLVVLRDASGAELYTRDNVQGLGGSTTSDIDLHRFFAWFICLQGDPKPPDMTLSQLTLTDKDQMVKYGYPIAAQVAQTNYTTGTSLWYLESYDLHDPSKDVWREVNVTAGAEIINVDRGLRRCLLPHFDLPINPLDQPVFTQLPAGEYNLTLSGDNYWWCPQVVKEFPEPTPSITSTLIHDAIDDQYKWESIDDIGGKVKVDQADSTAGYLSNKIIGDTDAAGNVNIIVSDIGADNTYKHLGLHVNVDTVYGEILDKMNPPSYDLFGAYPDEVGVCQLTGIGASLKAKTLKDQAGNNLAWNRGTGENGANYGRGCVPGYAYVITATGSQVQKRVWCAFGSTGEIYNSFDRYQTTTRDTSLITADSSAARIPQGNASCAAYIKDGSDYYWMYGGFVDNYVYLLHDIPANYNDDGTFKSVGWVWTACPDLPKNVSHICSVVSGGFLYAGYQLGGIKYKPSIAGAGVMAISNPPRTNADLVRVVTGDGVTTTFAVPCLAHQSYNSPSATAIDSNSSSLPVTSVVYDGNTNSFNVQLTTAPASGLSVTLTVSSYQFNASYDGAGFSGVGSDHYGTYNTIDRDTGRIWTNTSEATTGTFSNSHVVRGSTVSDWKLLDIFVRNSSNDSYPTAKSDRLGTSYGTITSDPYTWWSSIQSAYGLWVATVALKQIASDPIYAYSDDGIHWTKYTDGVGTGTGSTLAIWDSQSDGMNWFVTNMYNASPLMFELLVDSIPAHKKLVAEKGIGIAGDAFLVDLPSASLLATDESGKIKAGTGSSIGAHIKLSDLQDVGVDDRTDGQVLTWITAQNRWRAVTPTGGGSVGAGVQGSQGSTGVQGTQGKIGPQGAIGAGTQGVQGSPGTNGVQGVQGTSGTGTGPQGASGAQGSAGITGAQGVPGTQGTQGAVGSGTQGVQGSTGVQGVQGSNGTGTGPQGSTGAQGYQGATGVAGSNGVQGAQGATGSGTQGVQGSIGVTGAAGAQGTQGKQGYQGATGSGTQGYQGVAGSGVQGATGATGAQGVQGTQGGGGSAVWSGTLAQYTALGSYVATTTYYITDDASTGGSGAQGYQGAAGAQGTQGATGVANITVSTSAPTGTPANNALWLVVSA